MDNDHVYVTYADFLEDYKIIETRGLGSGLKVSDIIIREESTSFK